MAPVQKNIQLERLAPSSLKILKILASVEEMGPKDICKNTDISTRTVRYALKNLTDQDLITKRRSLKDARLVYYHVKERDSMAFLLRKLVI